MIIRTKTGLYRTHLAYNKEFEQSMQHLFDLLTPENPSNPNYTVCIYYSFHPREKYRPKLIGVFDTLSDINSFLQTGYPTPYERPNK